MQNHVQLPSPPKPEVTNTFMATDQYLKSLELIIGTLMYGFISFVVVLRDLCAMNITTYTRPACLSPSLVSESTDKMQRLRIQSPATRN